MKLTLLLTSLLSALSACFCPLLLAASPVPPVCQDSRLLPPDCYPLAPTPPANTTFIPLQVTVNSNQDGAIQADDVITLREAIQITNGTLPVERLTPAEKAQIGSLAGASPPVLGSRIRFNLPPGQTIIRLIDLLPPLASPGLVIDGTTQPSYDPTDLTIQDAPPKPAIALTPAPGVEVFRGLTVVSDRVTIRGLRLYGFTASHLSTAVTPPADIFISHRLPPPDTTEQQAPAKFFPFYAGNVPPQGVVIQDNWLGIPPDSSSLPRSAFGISVFNGIRTVIRRNLIANHDGSGIITSVRAEELLVTENVITGNGLAGMPDAVRLEGVVTGSRIFGNWIYENSGSAVFVFKPDGAVRIEDNQIRANGRRLRRAAIYLTGNDHQVLNNQIWQQPGPGVVVAAYPQSQRNRIQGNQFRAIAGLSIDLNTQENVDVRDYQQGDGPNPPNNSPNRRRETGNGALEAPRFLSSEFFILNNQVVLDGRAEPGSQVDVYRVTPGIPGYGALSEPIGTAIADAQGRFSLSLETLEPGDRVSAIATHPEYGTSEPAVDAVIQAL